MNITEIANDDRHHRRLLKPTDTDGVYDMEIDSTTLSTYMECPRKFLMYAVLGRDTGERDALNYGSALHEVMEQYFRLPPSEHATCLPSLIETLASYFNAHPCSSGSWRNLDHAINAIKQWFQLRQQLPVWDVYYDAHGPYVERPFRLSFMSIPVNSVVPFPTKLLLEGSDDNAPLYIGTVRVFFTGKIDLVIRDTLGRLRLVDHKTSSMAGTTFWGQFSRSPQMRGYTYAASKLLKERVPGVLIHALFGRKPTKTGIASETETCEFDYDDESLDAWQQSTAIHLINIVAMLRDGAPAFPENAVNCQGKYGACDYKTVCNAPKMVQHMHLLSGAYADRTWSPLNHV